MKPVLLLAVVAASLSVAHAQNKIMDRSLLRRNNTDILVRLTNSLDPLYRQISTRRFSTRGAKLTAFRRSLRTATSRWHEPVLRGLRSFNVQTKSYWLTNQISVKGANPRVVSYLSSLPAVQSIEEDRIIYIEPMRPTQNPRPPPSPQWGVERIGAPQVWNASDGTQGAGVIVGIIDSGVRHTHVVLRDGWVGYEENGWYDAVHQGPEPQDNAGHGTHVAGTTVGRLGFGVAPEAQWMACRACDYQANGRVGCPVTALFDCGEFMTCPTDVEGQNADCDKAPHVINNSWGNGPENSYYDDIIRGWDENEIHHAFAIGNNGRNGCMTASSPGDRAVAFSVGATAETDQVADFSSKGPTRDGRTVPIVVAPGVAIWSSWNTADDAMARDDGTSMASPHVAGALALLASADPSLSVTQARNLLIQSTYKGLTERGENCGGINEDRYPNNVAGNGLIQVNEAFKLLNPSK